MAEYIDRGTFKESVEERVIASRARRREKTTTDAGVVLVGLTICSTR